jgi:hypothetical protein
LKKTGDFMSNIRSRFFLISLFTSIVSLHAAPMISVDTANYDFGIIPEGSLKFATHTFVLKNTGDSPLIIESVRPGCGCTTVSYDSVIPPKKTGKVTSQFNTSGYIARFEKGIMINSNAKNEPSLRVYLSGTIQPIISFSENYIRLKSDDKTQNGKLQTEVILKTQKSDFKITEASFTPHDYNNSSPSWQKSLAIFVETTLIRAEKPDSSGYYEYKMNLSLNSAEKAVKEGNFNFKTNHPSRAEVLVSGVIEAK